MTRSDIDYWLADAARIERLRDQRNAAPPAHFDEGHLVSVAAGRADAGVGLNLRGKVLPVYEAQPRQQCSAEDVARVQRQLEAMGVPRA